MKKVVTFISMIAISLIFLGATPSKHINHKVISGESISLICIDYYGQYSTAMGKEIQKINPSISNINIIKVGQNIKFPKPVTEEEVAASPVKSKPLFKKAISVQQGVVTAVVKDAYLIRSGKKSELTVNTLIQPDDTIITGNTGRVEIIINKESISRIKENSEVAISRFRNAKDKNSSTVLDLKKGNVWTKVKRFTDKLSRFQLTLPTAIAGVHGTVYESSVDNDSSAEVKVFEGEVGVKKRPETNTNPKSTEVFEVAGPSEVAGPTEVSMEHWLHIVRSMQKIRVGKDGSPSQVTSFKNEKIDSWEEWNLKRDKQLSKLFGE